MKKQRATQLASLLKVIAVILILKTLASVLLNYRNYIPPNFDNGFLLGRDRYFWHGYHWAFYLHLASGPSALILGLLLMSDRFRVQFPGWHRRLGRVQAINLLLFLVPSGFVMAFHAAQGPSAGLGFALLALATALSVSLGWRTALQRRFAPHRRWMQRCFILLCSAVLVRVNGGLGEIAGITSDWYYLQAAWTTWLVPLFIFELAVRGKNKLPSTPQERGPRSQRAAQNQRIPGTTLTVPDPT